MFSFQIVNLPNYFDIDRQKIQKIIEKIDEMIPKKWQWILNIAFVPDDEMQYLNREYRGIDKTTDVLSFHYFDDFSDLDDRVDTAGECIFSEQKILSQARDFGHSPEEEFEILCIHSILHILGFDHETDEDYQDMWWYESQLREYFNLNIKR